MTPTEAEAAAREAQERYAMLLAMIEYGKAERARYERQMACVMRPAWQSAEGFQGRDEEYEAWLDARKVEQE